MMSSEMKDCDEAIVVDDCGEDQKEEAYVTIRDDETGVEVRAPYIREMVAWDYLSNVIRPSVGLKMDEAGVSVSGRVWYGEQKDEFGLYSPQIGTTAGCVVVGMKSPPKRGYEEANPDRNANPDQNPKPDQNADLGATEMKKMKKMMVKEASDCHDEEHDDDVLMLSCFGGAANQWIEIGEDGKAKKNFVFDRANRLCKVGEAIPNHGVIHFVREWPNIGEVDQMYGNGSFADVRGECQV
jgi:hypothetical protein